MGPYGPGPGGRAGWRSVGRAVGRAGGRAVGCLAKQGMYVYRVVLFCSNFSRGSKLASFFQHPFLLFATMALINAWLILSRESQRTV